MKNLYLIVFLIIMVACGGSDKKQPALYDPNYDDIEHVEEQSHLSEVEEQSVLSEAEGQPVLSEVDESTLSSGEVISVPFIVKDGVKYIEVKINNAIGVDMILDSGCSGATISISEALYLYSKGVLTEDDIEGTQNSTYADGRMELNQVVNLREINIGGKITCNNVKATIIENPQVPLLLGNDVLDRVASYEVDNQKQVINFKIN